MSFYDTVIKKFKDFDFDNYFEKVTDEDIKKSINKKDLNYYDFLNLISDKAKNYIEEMAQLSHKKTVQFFGHTMQLYIPIYVSNYCSNECTYCGFNVKNKIKRRKLTLEEVETEAKKIAETGMKHILFLTGENIKLTPIEYLVDVAKILEKHFDSVSIEIMPLDQKDYEQLKNAGVDGLAVYQEVYDEEIYEIVHLSGRKSDYHYRLETPDRGAKAGFRSINIGPLFGLGDIKKEAFFSAMHAKYLEDTYLGTEISLSIPRINAAEGEFKQKNIMDDKTFVQVMSAYRLFLPRVGINVSTRENAKFRENIISLGVTKISAGSKTEVGGYTEDEKHKSTPQFEISDDREPKEIIDMIREKGFQPIFKDWTLI